MLLLLGLAAAAYPAVQLKLSPTFDQWLCGPEKMALIQTWTAEAYETLPSVAADWEKAAAEILPETVRRVGVPFKSRGETATLMICPNHPALGTPLLVPLWPFLKSATGAQALDRRLLPAYLFHELLHPYVYDILPFEKPSPLKTKYKDEKTLTLAHLHLMAIQMAVYQKLGHPEVLDLLYDLDRQYSSDYQRAWNIVRLEGPDAFIAELR